MRNPRALAFAALIASVGLTGCPTKSKPTNEGKTIEGKWQLVGMPDWEERKTASMTELKKQGVHLCFEFRKPDAFEIRLMADNSEAQKLLEKSTKSGSGSYMSAKYRVLASGNEVEIFDVPSEHQGAGSLLGKGQDRGVWKFDLNGDDLTVTLIDNSRFVFTRVK